MRNLRQKSTTTCSDIVPIENNSNIVKEDILDHQPSKSTTLPHEKHQKKRSISNLLRKNQDSGTKKTTKVHESTLSNLRSNASTDSHRRKKSKKNVDTCFQRTENEVENSEGDNETISTFLGNRLKKSCNKNGIRQTKKKVSFSLPLQEGTSKHKPIKKDSETKISRASRPNANGTRGKGKGKGKGVHIEKINGAKNKDETAEVMAEVGGKRTKKNSEKDTIDEIPMDVVEFMSKLQYERSLPDMGNTTGMVDEPIKESGNSIRENIVSCENGKSINLKKRNKQVKKRDTNINNPKSNGPRTLRNKNVEGLMDKSKQSTTPSNAAIGAEMLQTVFNSHHGNSKLKISSKKSGQTLTKSRKGRSSKSTMQNEAGASNNICESVCTINRNPADITVIEETNAYMINGEDIIFEDNVPEE
ncbi:hypothetical protein TanjilG_04473 [Lupinus angustifolius]|uniref:Uncharacterized protein n=1 Tax=Lupinus angustifolius TaxID=3871 RepID=A0A4P1RPX2_LUPAN|nr:hypothetical protein TanjilG_04473 [Lupinus angustifolius]